jgi:iron complex outermembrane receptor protein
MKNLRFALATTLAIGALNVNAQQAQVLVTGSSIPRVVTDEALPVQIISREDIQRLGVVTTEELVQRLPALQSLGARHSNLDGAGGVTNYAQATPSLRGLGDSYTVVLLNGRPSLGNLNLLPLSAIDRIEVLLDGASSIYGADAIGGVINFVTVQNFQGLDAGLRIGMPTRNGGGDRRNFSMTFGTGDYGKDGFNLSGSIVFEKERELLATDREFAKTGVKLPYFSAGATGQGNIEGAYDPKIFTKTAVGLDNRIQPFGLSPGSGLGNPLAAQNRCGDVGMFLNPQPSSRKDASGKGVPYCTYDSSKDVRLVPDRESISGTLAGRLKLSGSTQLFADFLATNFSMVSRYQPSPSRYSFLRTSTEFEKNKTDPALLIYPANPNYKLASDYLNSVGLGSVVALGKPLSITSRVFDFGPRTNTNDLSGAQAVVGFRGELGSHSWEVAALNIVSNIISGVTDGYFFQEPFARIVSSRNDWNPWAAADAQTAGFKQAVQAAKYVGTNIEIDTFLRGVDGKLNGPAITLPGGEAEYAVGFQALNSGVDRRPSSALASGDIAGLGGAQVPFKKDRGLRAVFAEVRAPVLKDFELNGSARSDDYSDFGNAITYKANARWKVNPYLTARASVGTGFRAPSLVQLFTPQTQGTSAQFTDPKFPTNVNQQVNAITGGNPELKPEESKQAAFGLVITPVRDFSVSIDAWSVKIDQKITAASTQEIVSRFRSGDSSYSKLVVLNSSTGEVETVKTVEANIGSADYRGVDVAAAYRLKVADNANLSLNLFGTLMNRADETSPSGKVSKKIGTLVEENGDPVIGAEDGGTIVRWKHLLSASYAVGNWRSSVTQNYYSGYETGRRFDGERNFIGPQQIYDAQLTYAGLKNWRLNIGVKNIFDKDPPIFVPASNQFAAGYDISMYDPRSRFVYFSANYRFQ